MVLTGSGAGSGGRELHLLKVINHVMNTFHLTVVLPTSAESAGARIEILASRGRVQFQSPRIM